jgi:hypothetical protein
LPVRLPDGSAAGRWWCTRCGLLLQDGAALWTHRGHRHARCTRTRIDLPSAGPHAADLSAQHQPPLHAVRFRVVGPRHDNPAAAGPVKTRPKLQIPHGPCHRRSRCVTPGGCVALPGRGSASYSTASIAQTDYGAVTRTDYTNSPQHPPDRLRHSQLPETFSRQSSLYPHKAASTPMAEIPRPTPPPVGRIFSKARQKTHTAVRTIRHRAGSGREPVQPITQRDQSGTLCWSWHDCSPGPRVCWLNGVSL